MENEKSTEALQQSFAFMKQAFIDTVKSTNISYAEEIIDEFEEASYADKSLSLLYFDLYVTERYWFVQCNDENKDLILVFVYDKHNKKFNHYVLNYEHYNTKLYFLENASTLLLSSKDRLDLLNLETIESLDHIMVPIKEEYLPWDRDFISPIPAEKGMYVILFDSHENSIGMLDLKTKSILYTRDLTWANYFIWEQEEVMIVKSVKDDSQQTISWSIMQRKDDTLITMMGPFPLNMDIVDVKFVGAPSIKHVAISFVPEVGYLSYTISLPRERPITKIYNQN